MSAGLLSGEQHMEAPMPRSAANVASNFELSASVPFGEGETGFSAQRPCARSSFEFVADDIFSAPFGVRADPRGLPYTAHYLFNSMPCAYTWFHH
jgi:hypothetical protein